MTPSATVTRSTSLLEQPELEAAVCRALHCDISALQSLNLGPQTDGAAADGFLSVCGSMTVNAVVKGRPHELHLFVKREDAKDVGKGMQTFQREGLFYDTVLPQLEKAWRRSGNETKDPDLGPAAYLGTDSVVVMEDLTRRGYGVMSEDWIRKGLDYQTVQQTLRAIARLHAAGLIATRCDGVSLAGELSQEHFLTRVPGTVGRRLYDVAADVIVKLVLPHTFKTLNVPQTEGELQRLKDVTRDQFLVLDMIEMRRREEEAGGILTVGHGDSWPNNVLVKRDAEGRVEHASLIDFQMVRLGPPAFDVLMYLVVATRRDFRQKHQDSLLRGYYEDLCGFCHERGLDLSATYSFKSFMASVERQRMPCLVVGVTYMTVLAGNDKDMRELFQDGEARTKFLLDADVRGGLIEKWLVAKGPEGDFYREIMQEYVEDFLRLPPRPVS